MGMDFIEKTKKSIKKGWDKSRVTICERDLLSRYPEVSDRSLIADNVSDTDVGVGEEFIVQCVGDNLVAYRALVPVAYFRDPPSELVRLVREGGGCADGTVAEVYEMSKTISIVVR